METIKQIRTTIKFPLWLKGYIDNGGIKRYDLVNLETNNYWKQTFYSKEEVIEYFKK